ncbi:ABC transporter ATP-binding protein [Mordavella massiliensis]|uniref:ABC transporter ATP-binding protein n=1 Tax=Mordavella massiliensis TaxID=1871024 RepID=A0A938X3Q5_9CLOT|nr:ABC transporter ATP-binding protein [Mordavella massiliensis]MBM6827642.1 ABC transporter ATP-binding protein [Mordavella massiliensis]HJB87388.1 ABC transporter ATP-binding protein [Candidatus Dorea faecigallinarum]
MAERENILELKDVVYSFHTYGGEVQAVRDVSFEVRKGEILGIVGESGCGKSVTAQCIMRLNPEPPGFFKGGEILFNGKDVLKMTKTELNNMRREDIGFVFQDPMTSLNPTMRIGAQIEEVFRGRKDVTKKEVKEKALEIMKLVGISDVEKRYRQYPHELSGGMKQRVMIAIALVSRPSMIICDEPTTSLDVTIEAQILDLLLELREKLGTSIIMITHDLGVIARLCDRVVVMYGGKIVEKGTVQEIFYETAHPYTKGLMESIARLDTEKGEKLKPIEGTPPDLFSPPKGCPFAARCEYAMDVCHELPPEQYLLSEEHNTCCWLQHEYAPETELKKPVIGKKGEVE